MFEVVFVFFYVVETKNVSHSFTESISEWSHLNLCSAYLGGDFFVSFRANADTEIFSTYFIVFLTETLSLSVQPVCT
jgi:hypothetical protein